MSNMRPDVSLVCHSDAANLTLVEQYLDAMLSVVCVNADHVCPTPNHTYLQQGHVRLIVYSDLYYERLLALVIAANAGVAEEDYTEDFRFDSSAVLIGFCICNQQTQGPIHNF